MITSSRVVEQISDGLNDYLIPKLILQPLAENAIDHGIDVSDNENPTLWLTIREEAEHIFFEIRDNGAGMTQEKADQILTYQSSGYGVRNVCDRIHVLYGEKGEMKIESTPGKGTRVFIRIPRTRRRRCYEKRYEKANSLSPSCINFIADALVRNLF